MCLAFGCGVGVLLAAATLGGPLPGPLPLFPAANWWNADIATAPLDPNSASYISFINNGGTRRLHPDFGGDVSPGSVQNYGMPYVVVDGSTPKRSVIFQVLERERRRESHDRRQLSLLSDPG